ncbi:MAG: DUF2878 domain-containing protein [Planctomycetota bacterium]|nr:DUF2878 domain-containing protein [Planctomycetota bacterium]
MTRLIVNIVAFQAGWFACVFSSAWGMPLAGALAVVGILAINLALDASPLSEARAVLAVAVPGAMVDTALLLLGVITFGDGSGFPLMFPVWVLALWLNFAATLNVSLKWLRGRWWLAAILGAIGGSTTYLAGAKLGALGLHENVWLAMGVIGAEWAIALPLASWAAWRLREVGGAANARAGKEALA